MTQPTSDQRAAFEAFYRKRFPDADFSVSIWDIEWRAWQEKGGPPTSAQCSCPGYSYDDRCPMHGVNARRYYYGMTGQPLIAEQPALDEWRSIVTSGERCKGRYPMPPDPDDTYRCNLKAGHDGPCGNGLRTSNPPADYLGEIENWVDRWYGRHKEVSASTAMAEISKVLDRWRKADGDADVD